MSALNVLVVDDHHANQKILTALLLRAGCTVDSAATGKEALDCVKSSAYDLILMDIQMPEMDGITATAHIRAMEGAVAETPIIAVTANTMQGDGESYLQSGMNGYVPKPVDMGRLFETISSVVGRETRPLQS